MKITIKTLFFAVALSSFWLASAMEKLNPQSTNEEIHRWVMENSTDFINKWDQDYSTLYPNIKINSPESWRAQDYVTKENLFLFQTISIFGYAILTENIALLKQMLDINKEKKSINITPDINNTIGYSSLFARSILPLELAVLLKNEDVIKLLLDYGANFDQKIDVENKKLIINDCVNITVFQIYQLNHLTKWGITKEQETLFESLNKKTIDIKKIINNKTVEKNIDQSNLAKNTQENTIVSAISHNSVNNNVNNGGNNQNNNTASFKSIVALIALGILSPGKTFKELSLLFCGCSIATLCFDQSNSEQHIFNALGYGVGLGIRYGLTNAAPIKRFVNPLIKKYPNASELLHLGACYGAYVLNNRN